MLTEPKIKDGHKDITYMINTLIDRKELLFFISVESGLVMVLVHLVLLKNWDKDMVL